LTPSSLKHRSARGAAVSFVGQGVRALLQLGSQFYIAHLISPSAFGLVAMVAPILRFSQLFGAMGLLEAVIQRPSISDRELTGLFWINLTVSATLALVFAAAAPLVAWFYGEPRLTEVMVWLCAVLLLGGVAAQPMAILNRGMSYLPLTLIDVLSTAGAACVGAVMAHLAFGYWALVGMQVANSLILCLLAWIFAGWWPSRPRWEPAILPLLSFGSRMTAFSVMSLFAESSDKVLLGAVAGSLALGLYDRSSMVVMMPLVLMMSTLTRVAIPLLSRLVDAAELYRRAYLGVLQTGISFYLPLLLCVVVFPECVIQSLLGSHWAGAVPIIRFMAIGAIVHPLIGSTSWLFVSQGRADEQLIWGSMGFAAAVASFVIGLPWGAAGVAAAWAIGSCLVWAPLNLWGAVSNGPLKARHVMQACVPLAVAAVLTLLTLLLVRSRLEVTGFSGLVFGLLLSYSSYGVSLAVVPGGRRFLQDTWALRVSFGRTSMNM
jgi:PST family polysaccharide transporter